MCRGFFISPVYDTAPERAIVENLHGGQVTNKVAMPFTYRLRELQFLGGRNIDLSDLTVFVGPNNSGKSRLLKDVLAITTKNPPQKTVLLSEVIVTLPTSIRDAADSYNIVAQKDEHSRAVLSFVSPAFDVQEQRHFSWPAWSDGLYASSPDPRQFAEVFGAALTASLSTARRLQLVEKGTLNGKSRGTLLQELYNGSKTTELSICMHVKKAFPEIEITLDFTSPPHVSFRVGSDFSTLPSDPREARPIMESCGELDEQGDGLRSYAGIVTALICADRPVVLIDEPEAFLHPPQAYRIGEFIASMISDKRQIIVATHSVDVLRGLVAGTSNLKVIRLDRVKDTTNFATLENNEVTHLYSDPLLSSAGVLNGLFYSGVVVTEADGDSRFYAAISDLVNATRDLHFINADNKQTVPNVLRIYRKMGVRAAGILDVDMFNNADEFGKQLDALGVTDEVRADALERRLRIEAEIQAPDLSALLSVISSGCEDIKNITDEALNQTHARQKSAIRTSKRRLGELRESASVWGRLKREGRSALSATVDDFDYIVAIFSARGVFINPAGELEASLGELLPWKADKKKWFTEAMDLIPTFSVNLEEQPWRMMSELHLFLDKSSDRAEV
jgi:predicted ATPase